MLAGACLQQGNDPKNGYTALVAAGIPAAR
jgi:hypothetical protein